MDSRRRTRRRRVLWLDHKGGGYARADHDGLEIEREDCDEHRAERVDGAGDPIRTRSRPDVHETSKAIIDDNEESTPEIQPLLAHT